MKNAEQNGKHTMPGHLKRLVRLWYLMRRLGAVDEREPVQKTLGLDDIRSACHASLDRLQTDYIDLYQLHLNDYPLQDALRIRDALETLVQEGKIRAYGWSTDSVESAKFFAQGEHCTAVQFQTNVIDYNRPMQEMCEQENIAAILRGPLAMGLLGGKYDLDSVFPDYGFAQHKGYGTAKHIAAIETYGATRIHRHTFAPIRSELLEINNNQ